MEFSEEAKLMVKLMALDEVVNKMHAERQRERDVAAQAELMTRLDAEDN